MSISKAIQARGLVRRFGELTAVAGVDLDARRGECLGILGPNGAGKTTTIEMLEGLQDPDDGEVEILGQRYRDDARSIRQRIGVQLQETRLQDKLTVFETLRMFRSFYREGRPLDEVLAEIGLDEKRDDRVVHLSGGQRQRLALGCALVNRPELLFLDEPTTGLDPQARRRVWEIVARFKDGGGTVILTTHYMEEAERLADDLAILDEGRVIARGSPSEIIRSLGADSVIEFQVARKDDDSPGTVDHDRLAALPGVKAVRAEAGAITLTVVDARACIPALLDLFQRESVDVEDLRTHRVTLEDVFVSLTGKQLRDG